MLGVNGDQVRQRLLSGSRTVVCPANLSQLMAYLGAKQRSVIWSWCAVNDAERKVYLRVWLDTAKKRDGQRLSYLIQELTGAFTRAV